MVIRTVTGRTLCLTLALVAAPGCRMIRARHAAADPKAESRELSRQGVSALELGAWERAELLLRRAAEAMPTDADSRRHLAEALWRSGQTDEAVEQARAASKLDPYDARLAIIAGEMLLATGEAEAAREQADRAIDLDSALPEAWALRGRAHRQLGDPDRALADLQRSLKHGPNDCGVLHDLAQMHQSRGEHQRALTAVHQWLDAYTPGAEPAEALVLEGKTYLAMGRPQMAVDSLHAALDRGDINAPTLYVLAECEAAAGRLPEAVSAAQQALAADASHEPSRALLARLSTGGGPTLR